jgi:polar amino acid transport system substrate-binding protein
MLLCVGGHNTLAKDLKASVAYIPLLAESSEEGAFVELVKAIDEVYTDGTISISVYPMARSINNVVIGKADFHVPMMQSPYVSLDDKPFRFASQPMGIVCFVIYSHTDNPITKEDILTASSEQPFPYTIETIRGAAQFLNFPFPTEEISKLEQSLKKIVTKRVDALIAAQEEADHLVQELKLKSIHRSLFACWDDVIIIPKGAKGDEIDQILSKALQELDTNGTLDDIRKHIHVPYDDWQSSQKTDW